MLTFTEQAVLMLVGAAIGLVSAMIGNVVQHYFASIQAEKQRAHETGLFERQMEEQRRLRNEAKLSQERKLAAETKRKEELEVESERQRLRSALESKELPKPFICDRCGWNNPVYARFCERCGERKPEIISLIPRFPGERGEEPNDSTPEYSLNTRRYRKTAAVLMMTAALGTTLALILNMSGLLSFCVGVSFAGLTIHFVTTVRQQNRPYK